MQLNPQSGPSRLRDAPWHPSPTAKRYKKPTRRLPLCGCLVLLPAVAATSPASPTSPQRRRNSRPAGVPPFYTLNGSEWVESGDWSLNGKSGAEYKRSDEGKLLQDNLPLNQASTTASISSSMAAATTTSAYSTYIPFNNGKRDRTSFYAVPLIIVFSVILFALLVLLLFGTLFYWKKKRYIRKRRRAIEADEGYGESTESEKEVIDEKPPSASPKRLRKLYHKTKAMTRFKGQRPQLIVARTTALERSATTNDGTSLRRRRNQGSNPSTSRPDSAHQTESEDEAPDSLTVARQLSRTSHAETRSIPSAASERSSTPEPASSTAPEPPAYTHGQSPSYSRAGAPSARQLEKRRMVEPAEVEDAAEPPSMDQEDAERERQGMSGHVATDDKAVLEARRQLASMPGTIDSSDGQEASAPHIALDMEGFEEREEVDELHEPSEPAPSNLLPAPPQAFVSCFAGMSAPQPELAPSAPDVLYDYGPGEASAPMEDDLNGDMETVIQSSSSVGWLPIYEASSRSEQDRFDHAIV